jgi:hypothetical protein
MTESPTSDEVLSHSVCRHSRHDSDIYSCRLDRLPYGQSVDDRSEHPHLISDDSIEPSLFELYPSEYIATTDHDSHLEMPYLYEMDDLGGERREEFWIYTISLFALESFT